MSTRQRVLPVTLTRIAADDMGKAEPKKKCHKKKGEFVAGRHRQQYVVEVQTRSLGLRPGFSCLSPRLLGKHYTNGEWRRAILVPHPESTEIVQPEPTDTEKKLRAGKSGG